MDEYNQKLYTENEAAEVLGMTQLMLARRRRSGKISAIKDGHFIRYTWQSLLAYQKAFQRRGGKNADDMTPEALLKALSKHISHKGR